MEINVTRSIIIIAICALVTFAERALPFVLFRKGEIPGYIRYLGKVLALAIMTTLVFYCMRSISFAAFASWGPAVISCVVTVLLHLWRGNTMLSIVGGTVCCMLLTQLI